LRLSPAFDLVPDLNQREEHVLLFDISGYYPGRHNIVSLGRRWGISNADSIVDQVVEAVRGWKEEFAITGVLETDMRRFRAIDTRTEE
jgi:hypothetical protein